MERTAAEQRTTALVFMPTDEGFKVYAPANPKVSFLVSGSADAPTCTCPEFQNRAEDKFRCAHIRAVEQALPASSESAEEATDAREERLAIQEEGNGRAEPANTPAFSMPRAQMMIKRSVSADGRINSLSVELTRWVNGEKSSELHGIADRMRALQEEIVGKFLAERNGNGADHADTSQQEEGAVNAKLLDIAGMKTKWGWRLFLNVQVNGDTVKMFGKHEDLQAAVRSAGYPDAAKKKIEGGLSYNLPCRVITSKSEDGRYTVIDRVLPPAGRAR